MANDIKAQKNKGAHKHKNKNKSMVKYPSLPSYASYFKTRKDTKC